MTDEQLQQAIDSEEKALDEFLQRANQEASFRRGRIAALKDLQGQVTADVVDTDTLGDADTASADA